MTGVTATNSAATAERFGDLLRRLRVEADLTQEALAERAGLSVRAVSDLERGVKRAPRIDTMRMLADGLGLTDEARAIFAATARRGAVPPGPRRAARADDVDMPSAPTTAGALAVAFSSTALIGREDELAEVVGALGMAGSRLVTLTGPGGVGKTRLALHVVAEVRSRFDGTVTVVELAPVHEARLVAAMAASACRLRDEGGADPEPALIEHLRQRRSLLVFDNCEHLLDAVARLTAMLIAGCPELRILATSRSRLGIRAEREVPLAPLALPVTDKVGNLEEVAAIPSVRLFVERAGEAAPAFRLTERNAAAVAGIVRRLDGLPLAIELAAARSRILPPAALLARLDRVLPLLTGGPRDLPVRQQTLRRAIAWSYDLLDPTARSLFRRLVVFCGGFTLDAAEYVSRASRDERRQNDDLSLDARLSTLDSLSALAASSLLHRDDSAPAADAEDEPRFRMLETIREFGLERVVAEGEEFEARTRQAAWCVELAVAAEPGLAGPDQGSWLDRLAAEHDNIRAALAWLGATDPPLALRLAAALWRFWWIRGHLSEGRQWLEGALAGAGADDAATRVMALYGLSTLATIQADLDRAASAAEDAVNLARTSDDRLGQARALVNLGSVAAYRGEHERATALLEEGLFHYRALGVKIGVPDALNELGLLAFLRGDFARAADYYAECVTLCTELGNDQAVAVALVNLGDMRRRGGEVDRAEEHFVEALVRSRAVDDRQGIAAALAGLGQVARMRADPARARERFGEALVVFRLADDAFGTAECLEGLGRCALAEGDAHAAASLISAAEAVRDAAGAPLPEAVRIELAAEMAAIRAALDADTFALAWTTGRVRPIEEIVAGVEASPD